MRELTFEELGYVSGGMKLNDVHGIVYVQDQTLSGYKAEYGAIEGAAKYYADKALMAVGLEPVNSPPVHAVTI